MCATAIACALHAVPRAQQTTTAPQTALRVLKITTGPSGSEANGTFVLSEERTIFSRAHDREVIAFFQWEGTPGPHTMVAQWRSPTGELTSRSAVDYVAKERRFGGYWPLTLTTTTPLGTWSVEAIVDGQPAGRLSFEIRDEKVIAAPTKQVLTQSQLYDRLNKAFVVVERATAAGKPLEPAAGFFSGPGRISTAITALDAADAVRIVAADAARRSITNVIDARRDHDWAVLADNTANAGGIPVAEHAAVGDRVFSMDAAANGGRILIQGGLTGQTQTPFGGPRWLAAFLNGPGVPGAPVLNEFGELVGLIGGSDVPGATRSEEIVRFREELKGVPVVPATLIALREGTAAVSIADLHARGDLVRPLALDEHVSWGGFAKEVAKGPGPGPSDQRNVFSIQEKTFVTLVNWQPRDRLRGLCVLRIYDAANKIVGESKAAKIDFKKGQSPWSVWTLAIPPVAGVYRADALIDEKPAWRGFVRVRP